MIAGAAISLVLPRILSVPLFGAWQNVTNTVSLLNNVTVVGTIQAVSRFVSRDPARAKEYQRAGFRMHCYVGAVLSLTFVAAAPLIAAWYHDEAKIGLYRLAGCLIGLYSFYAVFVGTANGRKEFHKQAQLDMAMATMRAVGILGLAALGYGVWGALTGWVIASVVILAVAALVVGRSSGDGKSFTPPMTRFFFGVAVYLVLLNLIMFADGFIMKRLAAEWFSSTQGWATDELRTVADAADRQVGLYGAAQILARLSYQAILAAAFVIFPLVSATTFAQDRTATHRYITTTLRYSLMFALGLACVFAGAPDAILKVGFKPAYAVSADALALLAVGYVGFSLFAIVGTILNGAGETKAAILSGVVTFALIAVGNYVVQGRMEGGVEMLNGAAIATASAMVVGAVFSIFLLKKKLGAALAGGPVLKMLASAGVAVLCGRLISIEGAIGALVECLVVGTVYLIGLGVTRALTKNNLMDIVALRKKE